MLNYIKENISQAYAVFYDEILSDKEKLIKRVNEIMEYFLRHSGVIVMNKEDAVNLEREI